MNHSLAAVRHRARRARVTRDHRIKSQQCEGWHPCVLKSEALWVWMPLLVCSGLYQPGRFVVLRLYSVFLQEEFEDA